MTNAGRLFALFLTLSTQSLLPVLSAPPAHAPTASAAAQPAPAIQRTRVAAVQKSVVDFRALARAMRFLGAPRGEDEGREVDPPRPVPNDLPPPPGFVGPGDARGGRDARPAVPLPPLGRSPAPSAQFGATTQGTTFSGTPPDVSGAVGRTHLMVSTHHRYIIQNRAGATLFMVTDELFWQGVGARGVFDTKLLYDPYGRRWIATACASVRAPDSSLLVGVSQTDDPTRGWNIYRLDVDQTDAVWGDYPSVGFNRNWIVVSLNIYTIQNDDFESAHSYAFEKADLYAGLPAPSVDISLFDYGTSFGATHAPAVTYDEAANDLYLLNNWNGGLGLIRQYTLSGPAAAPTLTPGPWFGMPGESWNSYPKVDFAPQRGTALKIQNNDERVQHVIFRNGSLWAVQTVFLPAAGPPLRSAVQWWELRPDAVAATLNALQQGRVEDPAADTTKNPPAGRFFAFPSLAVNRCGDALVGYARFAPNQYASANYSLRLADDPANRLRSDVVLKVGVGPYDSGQGPENRWGDYSSTVVDPLDDLTMWTIQEYAVAPSPRRGGAGSGRWGTWWGQVRPARRRGASPCPPPR